MNHKQKQKRVNEIINLLSKGYKNQEIADTLFMSRRTLEAWTVKIKDQYGAKTLAELIAIAFRKQEIN